MAAVALALGACGNREPSPVATSSNPNDYSVRLNDPNVSQQEKDAIRQSMTGQSGAGSGEGGSGSGSASGSGASDKSTTPGGKQ